MSPSSNSSFEVFGPLGGLATQWVFPNGFDSARDKAPLAILMHGALSSMDSAPLPFVTAALAKEGIVSLLFDFQAHGKSEGEFIRMTPSGLLADAKAVLDYARTKPFVGPVILIGHSMGGLVAGMLAGKLENLPSRPHCIIQLAPSAIMRDDAINGHFWVARFNAADPPEFINVFTRKMGRDFLLEAQRLPIYETSALYTGKVCLLHGSKDVMVPVSYSERYTQVYRNSVLHILPGEGHTMNNDPSLLTGHIIAFLRENLGEN